MISVTKAGRVVAESSAERFRRTARCTPWKRRDDHKRQSMIKRHLRRAEKRT